MAAGPIRSTAVNRSLASDGSGGADRMNGSMTTPATTTTDHAGKGQRPGSCAQEEHRGDRHEDDPDEIRGAPRHSSGRDQADEQDGQSDDRHRRDQGCQPVAPVKQHQGRPERGHLDEREDEKPGRANARSTSPKTAATAMNANAAKTAVRFRMRRSGSSAGSAPMSRTRAGFIERIRACRRWPSELAGAQQDKPGPLLVALGVADRRLRRPRRTGSTDGCRHSVDLSENPCRLSLPMRLGDGQGDRRPARDA